MKKEWLVADVTAVESLNRAEHVILGGYLLGVFLANPGHVCGRGLAYPGDVCGRGAILWHRNPLLSSNNFAQGNSMKIERLVNDITAIGSPGRAGGAIYGLILAGRVFGRFRIYLWSLNNFVM